MKRITKISSLFLIGLTLVACTQQKPKEPVVKPTPKVVQKENKKQNEILEDGIYKDSKGDSVEIKKDGTGFEVTTTLKSENQINGGVDNPDSEVVVGETKFSGKVEKLEKIKDNYYKVYGDTSYPISGGLSIADLDSETLRKLREQLLETGEFNPETLKVQTVIKIESSKFTPLLVEEDEDGNLKLDKPSATGKTFIKE